MTINELRKLLNALEAEWTEMDNQYLGEFGDQKILADTEEGLASVRAVADFPLGLVLIPQLKPKADEEEAKQALADEAKGVEDAFFDNDSIDRDALNDWLNAKTEWDNPSYQ